jgi:hypothetical protein
MKRREFIKLLGGAAMALPSYTALAQSQIPLVGFLNIAHRQTRIASTLTHFGKA